jgi:hypothetical protein
MRQEIKHNVLKIRFKAFLIAQGASYSEWEREFLRAQARNSHVKDYKDCKNGLAFLNKCIPYEWINFAFTWTMTHRGERHIRPSWSTICEEWQDSIAKYKIIPSDGIDCLKHIKIL